MFDQLQIAKNIEEQIALHDPDAIADDRYEPPCKLDGSIESMHECLETLATLIRQDSKENNVPVLEFQFGDIVTMTSLMTIHDSGYLSITALLPRQLGNLPRSSVHLTMSATTESARNILWHADKGCYVISRKLPISIFPDERSVLDAIADTSEQAASWLESVSMAVIASKK